MEIDDLKSSHFTHFFKKKQQSFDTAVAFQWSAFARHLLTTSSAHPIPFTPDRSYINTIDHNIPIDVQDIYSHFVWHLELMREMDVAGLY